MKDEVKLRFDDILHLEEIGLINTSQTLNMTITKTEHAERTDVFWFGETGLALIKEKECQLKLSQVFSLAKQQ